MLEGGGVWFGTLRLWLGGSCFADLLEATGLDMKAVLMAMMVSGTTGFVSRRVT